MVIIIICEKPDAAMRMSRALAEKDLKKKTSKYGVDYYEFMRNGKKHIVVAAVGHLFNLKQNGKGWDYPVFDADWVPSFKAIKTSAFSEKYFRTIEQIANENKNSKLISAADYDNEGSVIAANIIKFIFNQDDAKRMKFSTLTKPDLIKSYDEMMPHLDTGNIESGVARHYLDYFYGVSTTRALTLAVKKNSKRFSIVSTGRVQGPVLTMLANKELEINRFKPKPYWQLQMILLINGNEVIALYEKEKMWDEKEATKIFKAVKGKAAVVDDVNKREYKQAPPKPFNITSLQTEAYRLFGYSPQMTLGIAQKLYTSAFISYPRTSSEKLLPQIGYKEILKALSNIKKYKKLCDELLKEKDLTPTEGKRTDPAHEAIHPTVEPPKSVARLRASSQRIYDLICRRYLTCFGKPATRESMKVTIKVNGNKFITTGRRTLEKGWMQYYGPYAKFDEIVLPDLKKGDKLKIKTLDMLSKETSPPPRFSQAAMIKEMEKRGLGTRATRAAIMQTLYNRSYVMGKSIKVTTLGLKVAMNLKKYVPDFVDEKLTRRFEKDLEKIMQEKVKKEKILSKAKKVVTKICDEFRKNEDEIGKGLGEAIIETQNKKATLGPCPNCDGTLKIMFSPFSKKMFVGCTSYSRCKKCGFTKKACKCKCPICKGQKGKCKCSWKEKVWMPSCQTGFPLPHNASFTSLEKLCDKCNTPIIRVMRKGKRPFKMCLDPNCVTKADWGKKKEKKGKTTKAVKKAIKKTVKKKASKNPKKK
ncbi:MAG: DNA topoisomerase I [Candidatus Aenigmatarchaeota archaeon]